MKWRFVRLSSCEILNFNLSKWHFRLSVYHVLSIFRRKKIGGPLHVSHTVGWQITIFDQNMSGLPSLVKIQFFLPFQKGVTKKVTQKNIGWFVTSKVLKIHNALKANDLWIFEISRHTLPPRPPGHLNVLVSCLKLRKSIPRRKEFRNKRERSSRSQ